MRHYVNILTGLLSISHQHNSFLSGKNLETGLVVHCADHSIY